MPKWAKRGRSRRHQPPRHHRRQPRTPRHRRRQPPFPTAHATSPPSTTPDRHVTAINDPKRHVTAVPPSSSPNRHFTAVDEPQTPRHRSQTPSPRHHGCPSPSQGMWAPKSTTGERGEVRRIGQGARRSEEDRTGSEEAREGRNEDAGEMGGEGGAIRAPSFPFFCSKSQRGGVTTTRRLIRARLSPPVVGGEFLFKRGPHAAPVFFSFPTGAA